MIVATFEPISGSAGTMTIGEAFSQVSEDWADMALVTYDDNVTSQATYYWLSKAIIDDDPETFAGCEPGWYFEDDGEPDLVRGCQNSQSLPFARGCVINGLLMSGAKATSAGAVSTINTEVTVPLDARRMTGNTLPRVLNINEVKQLSDDWADMALVTYDKNVTSQNTYYYLSQAIIEDDPETFAGCEPGWYPEVDGEPDIETGRANVNFDPGEGFVINGLLMSGATYRLPKAN